ncbi:hypothetical protein KBZ07_09235 [Cyanobium sp. BA20m-14]|uniref:hypothetical protein n=1 Tax=Cyanobium sp. BA20m-14 TaxID=2823703 RepID=UPI0020CB9CA9|nr:hypothetical protein [Cyanobium sp. BA20m-14]MCP9913588.1 hypothetical protein [Cyanobium sp. BA20m-14]
MACSALISLLDTQHSRQGNWWLPDGGFPQHLASLLGSPLRASGRPPKSWHDLQAVFEPLGPLASRDAPAASYRYLLCLDRRGSRISCWRRYPEGLGWQRRCGPMPLAQFIRRFQQPAAARRASS